MTYKPTNCHFCGYLCAFTATVEDGRITHLEPDPSRYPYDAKVSNGCRRWKENIRFLQDPARINHPMKRVGQRGSGQFVEVSWDEAMDDIASRLQALAQESGPWTLASAIGGPHATFWPLHRFMNLFGSPNNMGIGTVCWNPRILMDAVTFGWTIEADIRPGITNCLVIWGTNPAQSDNSLWWRQIIDLSKTDMPIVVIDPRFTQTAAKADLWLAPKPGTDGVLALGAIHVIFEEGLQDQEFIDAWCYGAEELKEAAQPYDPQTVANICGLSAQDVCTFARMFAKGPAATIVSGRGIDQVGRNVAPTHRAIACLRAITGNVDKPGAMVLSQMSSYIPEVELELPELFSEEGKAHSLNNEKSPLQSYAGYELMLRNTQRLGRTLPKRYLTSAHPSLVWRAMAGQGPYPIRALIVQATNPLLTYADTHLVYEAINNLDLMVVLEYTMTPTAMMADYVMPAASAMERPLFQIHGGVANVGYGGPAAVPPAYERHTDYEFFRGLGLRLGQEQYWPDETLEDAYDSQLRAAGTDWQTFCKTGLFFVPDTYYKHAQVDQDTNTYYGFATSTGLVELASPFLESLGGDRVPRMVFDEEELPLELAGKGTVLTCLTGSRKQPYNGAAYHEFETFRKAYPKPLAQMNQHTADALGLQEGDVCVVATDRGQARFTLHIARMRDDIIDLDYGWWYPESLDSAPNLGGIWDSNVNTITSGDIEGGEPLIGTWYYNGFPCVVWKEQEHE